MPSAADAKKVGARLSAAALTLIAFSITSRIFQNNITSLSEATIAIISAVIAIIYPFVGAAASGTSLIFWSLSRSPGFALVIALIYAAFLVKSLRRWWLLPILMISLSLSIGVQGMELISIAMLLAAVALMEPKEAATITLLYALLLSFIAALSLPQTPVANRGMMIIPTAGIVVPQPSTSLYDIFSIKTIEAASYLLTIYLQLVFSNDMLLLLQIFTFAVAGYTISKLTRTANSRLALLSAGVLSSGLIVGTYAWSLLRTYDYLLPPEYYMPLLIMTPSFLTVVNALQRTLQIERVRIRTRRGGPLPSFRDVGGLHDIKRMLYESVILPLKNRSLMEKYGVRLPRGILLYGPPGCGKTLLMKALAREAGIKFLYVKSNEVLSKWYGESERKLAELFTLARNSAPSILFFDEIDALARSRESYSSDDVAPRLLSILLTEIDGLEPSDGVIVVGSTNIPQVLDPALLRPGRFDQIIYVPPPDYEARIEIFQIHTRKLPLAEDVDFNELAKLTEGFSGADISAVCQEVAKRVAQRALRTKTLSYATMNDFLEVLRGFRPSITSEMLESYEEFRKAHMRTGYTPREQRSKLIDIYEAKAAIHNFIKMVTSSRSGAEQPIHSLLVFGPPGCGKSTLVEEAAELEGMGYVSVDVRLAGSSDKLIEAFNRAVKQAPSVLIIEEFNSKPWGISTALHLVESARKLKRRVLIALTSSSPSQIPVEAVSRGLFDRAVYVPPPDEEVRIQVISSTLDKLGVKLDFDLNLVSDLTADYSVRSIIIMAKRAASFAIERGDRTVSLQDFVRAKSTLPPDLSPEVFFDIERFIAQYQGLVAGFKEATGAMPQYT